MGLYPKPVLDKMEPAARHYLQVVKGVSVAGDVVVPVRGASR
jgi:hypothetical protein